jgi:hypothetical protein
MDDGSAINILSSEVMAQMRIDPLKLIPMKTHLIRIIGINVLVNGALKIPVIVKTFSKCITLQQTFMVIDMSLTYNAIIRRPLLHKINVVISSRYLALKFPTHRVWPQYKATKYLQGNVPLHVLRVRKPW